MKSFVDFITEALGFFISTILVIIFVVGLLTHRYAGLVKEVIKLNSRFDYPIRFRYSWLQGVCIESQIDADPTCGPTAKNIRIVDKVKE